MTRFNCILLVDDDDVSNFINEKVIETAQIADQTHVRRNGLEALEFVKSHCSKALKNLPCPEVILLDIRMPIMDGFEFLQEFEKTKNSLCAPIKIILLTSSNNPMDVDQAFEYDISGYLNKPLSVDKLNEAIASLK